MSFLLLRRHHQLLESQLFHTSHCRYSTDVNLFHCFIPPPPKKGEKKIRERKRERKKEVHSSRFFFCSFDCKWNISVCVPTKIFISVFMGIRTLFSPIFIDALLVLRIFFLFYIFLVIVLYFLSFCSLFSLRLLFFLFFIFFFSFFLTYFQIFSCTLKIP